MNVTRVDSCTETRDGLHHAATIKLTVLREKDQKISAAFDIMTGTCPGCFPYADCHMPSWAAYQYLPDAFPANHAQSVSLRTNSAQPQTLDFYLRKPV